MLKPPRNLSTDRGVADNGYGLGTIDNVWKVDAGADFNNDNVDDIAFRNSVTGELLLWKMAAAQKVDGYLLGTVDLSWKLAAAGDTNGDGHDDIVWANSQSGEILRWGVQNFNKLGGSLVALVNTSYNVVGFGDFNNNNIADLLYRNASGDLVVTPFNVWNQANLAASDFNVIA